MTAFIRKKQKSAHRLHKTVHQIYLVIKKNTLKKNHYKEKKNSDQPSNLPLLVGKSGGRAVLLAAVQIGTLIIGLILMLADRVLSSPFLTTLSLLPPAPFFLSSAVSEEEDEDDEEDEEGDKVEGRCFLSLNSSFHKTVHFGGLGEGSSSMNQLILRSSVLVF